MRRKLITVAAAALIACFSAFILSSCGDSASSDPIVGEWHSVYGQDESSGEKISLDADDATVSVKRDGTITMTNSLNAKWSVLAGTWKFKETNNDINYYLIDNLGKINLAGVGKITDKHPKLVLTSSDLTLVFER